MWLSAALPVLDSCWSKGASMLEGKFPQARVNGHESGEDSESAVPMRPLSWSDIRARLEAARDLREALSKNPGQPHASFASQIAAPGNSKQHVNLTDLANGKGSHPIDGASTDGAETASRGNT